MKTCKKCLVPKPLSEFYKHPQMGDGHLSKCKECTKADVNDNRAANLEYYRQYDRMRYDREGVRGTPSLESRRRAGKKWNEEHREEKRRHVKVKRAVASGMIVKPATCSRCHRTRKVEAHHPDYSRPIDVEWMCKSCHGKTWKKPRLAISAKPRGGKPATMLPSRAV